jgi:hypothetical protein
MSRVGKAFALALILVAAPATAFAVSDSTLPGSWRKLPPAPLAVDHSLTGVWTGRQLIVFGVRLRKSGPVAVAADYDPAGGAWRRLTPPTGAVVSGSSVWTGKEMLLWGPFSGLAFNPSTNRWRPLRQSLSGIVVWTGREAIGWGGGCCGDAWSTGSAFNPATGTWRKLARSPLAPSQQPTGAWTGHELVLFVSGYDPDGKPWPARLARAAAYNPVTDTWRRIAPLPQRGVRWSSTAVWDGREVLVVAADPSSRSAFAYNPVTNRRRRLASMSSGRVGATTVWTGTRLLLWGGEGPGAATVARAGLVYEPRTDRWSALPVWPLQARAGSAVVWTGRSLIVWGGVGGTSGATHFADGAVFTPATP